MRAAPRLLGLLSLLWAGCHSRSEPPARADLSPRIRLETPRLDLGRIPQDQPAHGTVLIRNDGLGALELGTPTTSRFCSAQAEATVIRPGQTTTLAVRCQSDLYGPLHEGIDLPSNDPRAPRITLTIAADVTPLLAFDVPSVELRARFGDEQIRDVHLVGTLVDEARPRLTAKAEPDTEIVPLANQAGFRLRCLSRKVGVHAGNIVIATGVGKPAEIAIPYVCNVSGTLDVSPSNPYFNLKAPGEKAVRIVVHSAQPGFEIRQVRITEGPFAARFEHAEDDNTYRIDVSLRDDALPDESYTATGTLLIVSNDRTEPQKEVPLFGSGRVNKRPGK